MKILIVRSPGAGVTRGAGEFARLKAVANVLTTPDQVEVGEAETIKLAGLRPLIAASLRLPLVRRSIVRRGLSHPLFKVSLQQISLPAGFKPDLVMTTLPPRSVPGALVATMFSAHWLHLGYIPRFWDYLYSCKVLSAHHKPPLASEKKTIRIDVLPTNARLSGRLPRVNNELVGTVVLGNNIKDLGYFFRTSHIEMLAAGLSALSKQYSVTWNISTSPRTKAENEDYLCYLVGKSELPIRRATWYRRSPEKSLVGMLGESDFALVTEDSRTMVSDAVATGIPTISVRPDQALAIKQGHNNYMDYLVKRRFLRRISIADVGNLDLSRLQTDFLTLNTCWAETLKAELYPLLNEKKPLA